ncbi:PKD domain-containing protein [Danxiaibacter flavus]|uniref:PKD domain-containing protein n=1 Tax=Danxiaibacter flavus TaxID=3049108 RepID=A0ABV3ZEY7_9BACT|nr:PKD domain-containing protein [Chitinophagaceae bacterium DXS]
MKTSGIFTHRASGLDRKVWLTMAVTVLLSFALASYRLITGEKSSACQPPLIFIDGLKDDGSRTSLTGEHVWFKTPIASSGNAVWDFGDSTKRSEGFNVGHTYTHEGIFLVTVTLDGGCVTRTKFMVNVRQAIVVDSAGNIVEHIIGSDQVAPGKYNFSTPDTASSYKWAIENDNNFDPQYSRAGIYTFRTEGHYTLKLVLNNDRNRIYRKEILVVDPSEKNNRQAKPSRGDEDIALVLPPGPTAPPIQAPGTSSDTVKSVAPAPVAPKPPPVIGTSPQTFKSYLQSLVCGDMDVKELYKYLADQGATKVIANKAYTTFDAFCKEIKGKKLEIESVEFKKEGDRITEINVGYDKKGRLARNPCKG